MTDINITQVKDTQKRKWFQDGFKTAMKAPQSVLQIFQRKREILESEVESKITENDLKKKRLEYRENLILGSLNERSGESPLKTTEMNFRIGMSLIVLTLLLWIAHFALTLWTFEPYGWGFKAYVLVIGITVIGSILVERVISDLKRLFPERHYLVWRLFLVMTAVIAIMTVGLYLAVVRGELSNVTLITQQAAESAENQSYEQAVSDFYAKSHRLLLIALPLLTIALEIGTGIMLHIGLNKIKNSWPILKLHRTLEGIREQTTKLESENKTLEAVPDVFEKEFLNGADMAAAEMKSRADNMEEYRAKRLSLYLIIFAVILLILIFSASLIYADTVVVALDLSGSTNKKDYVGTTEFEKNKKTIINIIDKLKPDTDLYIMGITEDSLGTPYFVLTAKTSAESGYFKETIKKDRKKILNKWLKLAKTLKPKAKETDIFGCIYLAESVFKNNPSGQKQLIFLSDMRNSKGINLESLQRINKSVLEEIDKHIRIPELKEVNIHVYGAHVGGKSEAYWNDLKSLWQEFFKKSGAKVVTYSILREIKDY